MFLHLPNTVRQVQSRLFGEARRRPFLRFGDLLPLVVREDVLASAYEWVRRKGGSAGLDGRGLRKLGDDALLAWAREERRRVLAGEYRAGALLRVPVPKPSGGARILGVPNVEDRILQTAVRFVIEPIFETGFLGCAWGYRPGRGVRDAVSMTHRLLCGGYTTVLDGDIHAFFDEVPHAELIAAVADRISDRRVLDLIRGWLVVPSVRVRRTPWERWVRKRGRRIRRRGWTVERKTIARRQGRGIPQGASISPLLANVYLHRFLVPWMERGMDRRFGTAIVNYADDFLVLSRGRAGEVLPLVRRAFSRLGLELNERKTRVVDVTHAPIEFLGYRFRVEPARTRVRGGRTRGVAGLQPETRTGGWNDAGQVAASSARSAPSDWLVRGATAAGPALPVAAIGVAPACASTPPTARAARDSFGGPASSVSRGSAPGGGPCPRWEIRVSSPVTPEPGGGPAPTRATTSLAGATEAVAATASTGRASDGPRLVVIAEPAPDLLARRVALLRQLIPAYLAATDPDRRAVLEHKLRPLVPDPPSWRGRLRRAEAVGQP